MVDVVELCQSLFRVLKISSLLELGRRLLSALGRLLWEQLALLLLGLSVLGVRKLGKRLRGKLLREKLVVRKGVLSRSTRELLENEGIEVREE